MITTRVFTAFILAVAALVGTTPARADILVPGQYPTIQAAVDAAPCGATIVIAAGVYEEQVTILFKDLTLRGHPGTEIRAPENMAETLQPASDRRAIVGIFGCDVKIRRLVINGAHRGNTNPNFNGVLYLGAGGQIRDCVVRGVRTEPLADGGASAPVRGINLLAFGTPDVDLEVRDNLIFDNFDGMAFTADDVDAPGFERIDVRVRGNTVHGSGPTDVLGQFGINLGFGVSGIVRQNTVTDCVTTIPGGFAGGILVGNGGPPPGLEMRHVLIHDNRLIDNMVGIASLFSDRAWILNNEVDGAYLAGIAVSGDRNRIIHNRVSNADIGIGMIGEEFPGFGIATRTWVIHNLLVGCSQPIVQQTGVTGTILHHNTIIP